MGVRENLIFVFLNARGWADGGSPAELELGLLPKNLCSAFFLLKLLLVPGPQAKDLVGVLSAPPAFPSRAWCPVDRVHVEDACAECSGHPRRMACLLCYVGNTSNLGYQTAEWEGCQGNSALGWDSNTHTPIYKLDNPQGPMALQWNYIL